MKWSSLRMEIMAGLIMLMQSFSLNLMAHGNKIMLCFSIFWTLIIFFLVWYALIKKIENKQEAKNE